MPRFPRPVRKPHCQRRLQFEPLDSRLALCTFVGGVVSVDSVWGDTINGYCVQADEPLSPHRLVPGCISYRFIFTADTLRTGMNISVKNSD